MFEKRISNGTHRFETRDALMMEEVEVLSEVLDSSTMKPHNYGGTRNNQCKLLDV